VWGLGALLETTDRHKFHSYLNENFGQSLDLPKLVDQPDATIFDFFVTEEGIVIPIVRVCVLMLSTQI